MSTCDIASCALRFVRAMAKQRCMVGPFMETPPFGHTPPVGTKISVQWGDEWHAAVVARAKDVAPEETPGEVAACIAGTDDAHWYDAGCWRYPARGRRTAKDCNGWAKLGFGPGPAGPCYPCQARALLFSESNVRRRR